MAMTWTADQQKVIEVRNRNILVSAAAGSGKTAVLVERILSMITDSSHPIDIDALLIVTFTRAAASEMKERIRLAIEKRLEQEPDNEHLQRQSTLIHHAQINTIDGFCAYVIRNYFHMIDLDPGYRTAEEGELRLLKQDVLSDLLEEAYAEATPEFEEFVECFSPGKHDENLKDQILKLHEYSMSYPWPAKWLLGCLKDYETDSVEELQEAPWMEALQQEADKILRGLEEKVRALMEICQGPYGPHMYLPALESDLESIVYLRKTKEYGSRAAYFADLKFARLSTKKDKEVDEALKEQVKGERDEVKKALSALGDDFYADAPEELLSHIRRCRVPVKVLIELTLQFQEAFAQKKREKNLLDFSDMEHFALDILVREEEGRLLPSQAAKDLADRFEEIFIDEYQDSNLVQETILTAVSRLDRGSHNIFMVGDVKQSIYRFRLARPELFMEKFDTYTLEDSDCQRIDLHKNFRSRSQVLAGVNYIFYQIMGKELGSVEYDEDAALHPGAVFPEGHSEDFVCPSLMLVDYDEELMGEDAKTEQETEALAVAEKIREMVGKEEILDKETGQYRKVRCGDIVILLRTMSGWAETFLRVLSDQGIASYSVSKTGYFSALEVVTVLNYLRILDNPRQDIPLASVLHSPMGGCSAQEMALLKSCQREGSLYDSLMAYLEQGEEESLRRKLRSFWENYQSLRSRVAYTPIHELLLQVLEETGYLYYAAAMPAGEQRSANLRMLVERAMEFEKTSYRGLFNFVRYIEQLQKYQVDYGEVNLSAGEDVVQIMSIHKSKGLEFPVVFVCGLCKNFNQQDMRASILIHQDLGIGIDCIDPKLRLQFPTVIKQVIRRRSKAENLGEELRVLYVAMTRAKEKLILTGCVKNLEDRIKKAGNLAGRETFRLPYAVLEGAHSYLDWILPALSRHPAIRPLYKEYTVLKPQKQFPQTEETPFEISVVKLENLVTGQVEKKVELELKKEAFLHWDCQVIYDQKEREEISEKFSYEYPHKKLWEIPVKVTVSELKRRQADTEDEESLQLFSEAPQEEILPKFLKEETKELKGAARGTVYHSLMEWLDWRQAASDAQVQAQIEKLIAAGKLTEQMAACIYRKDIVRLAAGSLGRRMAKAQEAGCLFREQPFVLSLPACQVDSGWDSEEPVLIQGIIDAYFIEDGEIVLVDYKTDRVSSAQELRKRYHLQMEYYEEALRRLTGRRVKERIIYSFALGEALSL